MTTKKRLGLPANSEVHGPVAPKVQILNVGPGLVTVVDKLKGYYKQLIVLLGALIIIANQVGPFVNLIGGPEKRWFTAGVALLTTVLAFLKENEHWVDDA